MDRAGEEAGLEVWESMIPKQKVSVEVIGDSRYRATIEEGETKTVHEVFASPQVVERYGHGTTAERLLKASFEFLLQREPKESILPRFELSEIERYFPDYSKSIRTLL
jgi:hypothetical protein